MIRTKCLVCPRPLPAGHNAKRQTCSGACRTRLCRIRNSANRSEAQRPGCMQSPMEGISSIAAEAGLFGQTDSVQGPMGPAGPQALLARAEQVEAQLARCQAALRAEQQRSEKLQGVCQLQQRQLEESTALAERLRGQLTQADAEQAALRQRLATFRDELAQAAAVLCRLSGIGAENSTLRRQLHQATEQANQQQRELEGARASLADAQAKAARLRDQKHDLSDLLNAEMNHCDRESAANEALSQELAQARHRAERLTAEASKRLAEGNTTYEALRLKYNTLVDKYNALVESHNKLVGRVDALVSRNHDLVGAYNALVEKYNRLLASPRPASAATTEHARLVAERDWLKELLEEKATEVLRLEKVVRQQRKRLKGLESSADPLDFALTRPPERPAQRREQIRLEPQEGKSPVWDKLLDFGTNALFLVTAAGFGYKALGGIGEGQKALPPGSPSDR